MTKKHQKINPHCHVPDCKAKLDHARKQFNAGKDKATVLAELKELHLPQNLAASMAKMAAARPKKKEKVTP